MFFAEKVIDKLLEKVKIAGTYRYLEKFNNGIDFFSNDYLGFAHSQKLFSLANEKLKKFSVPNLIGSTGSRLISGNYEFTEKLEEKLARFYNSEAGLIFNSGYVANLGLLSTLPQRNDTILYDELVHASIRDGIRLSFAKSFSFKHNDPEDLKKLISKASGNVYVVTESVFSMDGDIAPLKEIADICFEKGAALIIDEAHSNGIFGENGNGLVCEKKLENKVFARIFTFSKAIGVHGAIVVGPSKLKTFLINFCRPFIFTTALSLHTLIFVDTAYDMLNQSDITILHEKSNYFDQLLTTKNLNKFFLKPQSPIKIFLPYNDQILEKTFYTLRQNNFLVKIIKSPTVPLGKERIRLVIHNFNTIEQIQKLTELIHIIVNQ